ncbi:MAG: flagellar motor switch protein FliN [Limnochordia bacterium]|jgi:flagellar motor switch protein FliN|nr:flagellar motor switch protein FliN [Limnochordia bacterium]
MSHPILSQDEIEALLRKGSSPSHSEELQEFLRLVAQNVTAWMNRASVDPLELDGPYVERLGKTLEQSILGEVLAVAVDLGNSELLLFLDAADATLLAERLQMPTLEAVEALSKAWISEVAELTGVSHGIYKAQSISLGELRQVAIQPQSYLVRHVFKRYDHRFEFCLVIQHSEYLETLVRDAMDKLDIAQAKEAAKGLLKGNSSKSPVTRAVFTPIDEVVQLEEVESLVLLEDIDLTVTVELGHTTLTLKEILDLQPQSVISLERQAGEPVDVYVNDTRSAKGEVVVLEENFGVRILEILPKAKRI